MDPSLDPRLGEGPSADEVARPALLTRYPVHHVDAAYRRAFWLHRWRELCGPRRLAGRTDRQLAADVAQEARRSEGGEFKIGVRSLQMWWRAYKQRDADGRPRGIEGLIPRHTGPKPRGPDQPSRSPEAVEYFYDIYHTQGRQSVRTCHEVTLWQARKKGWTWPESYSATVKWLQSTDRRDLSCLHRDGPRAYANKYLPYIQVDWSTIEPGFWYVCDHTQMDLWCRHRGTNIRPWLTSIMDCRSRCVVGWHVGDSPHQDSILAAMRMAFADWAVPQRLRMDRGRDFCSKLLTGMTRAERTQARRELGRQWKQVLADNHEVFWGGVLGELGIEVIFAIPYHPWSKGLKERWYGTIEDHCAKTFTTYTGNKPDSRPECLEDILATETPPDLEEVRSRLAEAVLIYHHDEHDGLDKATPLSVWQTATRLRKAPQDQLIALMQARGVYRVQANGVSFRVAGRTWTYGRTSGRLHRYIGRDVFITLDPADCSCCYAYTPERDNRRFIDRLEANETIPADTPVDQLREACKNINRRRRDYNRAAREAPKRMRTAAAEVASFRHEQAQQLRRVAGGNAVPGADIAIVRTGFEGTSQPVRRPAEQEAAARRRAQKALELEDALWGKPRLPRQRKPRAEQMTLADLYGPARLGPKRDPLAVDGEQKETGTEAGTDPFDLLRKVNGGVRHGRSTAG